jgi:hypothetical protein
MRNSLHFFTLLARDYKYALDGNHIRTAMELRRGHPARRLFAEAAARGYFRSNKTCLKPHYDDGSFWLQNEVDKLNGFAADLLPVVAEIIRDRVVKQPAITEIIGSRVLKPMPKIFPVHCFSIDPLTKE